MAKPLTPSTTFEQAFTVVGQWVYTLFLFTKSDIKTTLVPVSFFALAAAPSLRLSYMPEAVIWLWLHLLQFNVSNQTMDPEEDQFNKRDRPLPSGRISLKTAQILRWSLVPICWLYSLLYSVEVLCASLGMIAATIVYNELGAHGQWLTRNVLNGLGVASFELASSRHYLDTTAIVAICLSSGLFATTIQAQDFKDVEGDAMVGRRTLPIIYPKTARYTVIVPLLIWSCVLWYVWQLDMLLGCAFVALASYVGYRYIALTKVHHDQVSYYWYNVWLSAANALPGYFRYFHQ
ncbi:unnamed protein product [Somion occarium]|uniref:Uncharacterized protein n=1 Tax=Somion occarium TaxID=3059160 RepID=A0ABP1CSY3_9APHY